MFIALMEIEELPAMREINEQIDMFHALIQSSVENSTEFEENKATLKVLIDRRMKMRKFYFNAYEQEGCIGKLRSMTYEG